MGPAPTPFKYPGFTMEKKQGGGGGGKKNKKCGVDNVGGGRKWGWGGGVVGGKEGSWVGGDNRPCRSSLTKF